MHRGHREIRQSQERRWAGARIFLFFRRNFPAARTFARAADEPQRFDRLAYVIMPEHVHLVLQPLPGVAMRTVLWQLKCPLTTRALAWVKEHRPTFLSRMADAQPSGKIAHRFWQRGGGYDRNLRRASDVHEKIAYIHDNPVRRGLAERAENWPWSSARDWILQRPGAVPIDWDYLPEPELR